MSIQHVVRKSYYALLWCSTTRCIYYYNT